MDINRETFNQALTEVVAEAGEDYIYRKNVEQCVYVYEGQADCIIARTLNRLGVDLSFLAAREGASANEVLLDLDVHDPSLRWAAGQAQDLQDDGTPWGAVLRKYNESLTHHDKVLKSTD